MSGISQWRSSCPDFVNKNLSKLSQSHYSIVPNTDPSKFTVQNGSKKMRLVVGNPHRCECKKEQPCIHVLFVLLNHFEVPRDSVLLFQAGMNDIELMDLLNKERMTKEIQDCCPLCKERTGNMSCCGSCRQKYHQKCIELAAVMRKEDHKCPKCKVKLSGKSVSCSQKCSHCKEILHDHYRCLLCCCQKVVLCKNCYRAGRIHTSHPFIFESVMTLSITPSPFPTENVQSLQYRDINPEDYQMLLLLDQSKEWPTLSASEFNMLVKRTCTDSEVGSHCAICLEKFTQETECVAMKCGHILHIDCGRNWLTNHRSECPIDHSVVIP